MLQKKICMLGSFAVGKTSLVARFVKSIYSDNYHTTIGVKIDKKQVLVNGEAVNCILWDIAGEDEFYTINNSYLRGMAGFILVIDGTRSATLEVACNIYHRIKDEMGEFPFVVAINKSDLQDEWEINSQGVAELRDAGATIIHTSAKNGEGVEEAFQQLVMDMVNFNGKRNG